MSIKIPFGNTASNTACNYAFVISGSIPRAVSNI
nr:MAG TPA: hypothetical protein [Caudoviricetes sp.]